MIDSASIGEYTVPPRFWGPYYGDPDAGRRGGGAMKREAPPGGRGRGGIRLEGRGTEPDFMKPIPFQKFSQDLLGNFGLSLDLFDWKLCYKLYSEHS